MIGILGGTFDPPHNGHVALVDAALQRFRPEALVVLVSVRPGHRRVHAPADARLRLAHAAFAELPGVGVELDPSARTVDLLREGRWSDPLFLVGADELAEFPTWNKPGEVLRLARLGVATRPGYPRERLEAVIAALGRPERVELFEMPPVDASSSEVRRRVAAGEPFAELIPEGVADLVRELDLYRRYTGPAIGKEPTRL